MNGKTFGKNRQKLAENRAFMLTAGKGYLYDMPRLSPIVPGKTRRLWSNT
jgi:hypothetical protein